ncbi:hypothetical protein TRIUR3_00755 [Triticum urartu]|uniref:Uncharacterized protein n=1 Tax=Triticum urartu TaxID=4572 RepID=M7Z1Q3_TRIUA|nr:hypothetical protein TRIUR3_00755 [Triticum urartu]
MALRQALGWSEDNSPEEPEVGVLWSDLHKLGIGLAGAALEPGVRAAEHSGLRQARTQACIVVVYLGGEVLDDLSQEMETHLSALVV